MNSLSFVSKYEANYNRWFMFFVVFVVYVLGHTVSSDSDVMFQQLGD